MRQAVRQRVYNLPAQGVLNCRLAMGLPGAAVNDIKDPAEEIILRDPRQTPDFLHVRAGRAPTFGYMPGSSRSDRGSGGDLCAQSVDFFAQHQILGFQRFHLQTPSHARAVDGAGKYLVHALRAEQ